jgi:hypothetical protein
MERSDNSAKELPVPSSESIHLRPDDDFVREAISKSKAEFRERLAKLGVNTWR